MTILVFIGSLLGLMALGMPIAFALIGCGLAMMYHMGVTDPQIVIQNSGIDDLITMMIRGEKR